MREQVISFFVLLVVVSATQTESKNETVITDPFEDDNDLRFAADTFCREFTLANPMGKIVLPYKPNCHFWWQCTAYELKKHECQGLAHRINLHYDLYLDRCEMPGTVKCKYVFDEEDIIMEHIMEFYKKQDTKEEKSE
ncbi:CLUMA_CG009048, isoform A [Clunio marinus]|uniref:CLUMA_CG009048, isoform A n=1 Tax=Clunio marinus TaxID=568069 RepID=A0A1J1I7N8_9DIPT|nr:CLUMA_CG009048, isoform A [Clunio marinus]